MAAKGKFERRPGELPEGEHSLAPDLARAAVRRLQALAFVIAVGGVAYVGLGVGVGLIVDWDFSQDSQLVGLRLFATGLGVALSLVVALMAERVAVTEERLLRLATAYMLVVVVISTLTRFASVELLGVGSGWSAVSILIVLFPVLIPFSPGQALRLGLIATAIEIAVYATLSLHHAQPLSAEVVLLFRGDLIAAGVAYVTAKVVDDLRAKLHAARKLGAYDLVECIGRGGMGEVWRAQHGLLARPAAIKLIKSEPLARLDAAGREVLTARFEREAQATALLESPHAIDIFDFGVADDGTIYYAMELLRGIDLDLLVREAGAQSPARVVHILLQACASLEEAHARGLVHRDIKPSNIYLCRYGGVRDFVKVLDFGLVKLLAGAEGSSEERAKLTGEGIAGTPAFLPPEQAMQEGVVDPRSDIYALGCVAYWLLAGALVFDARSAAEFVVKHVNEAPERPSVRGGVEVPASLEALVMACLEKQPDRRPQSIAELEQALRRTGLVGRWGAERAQAWWAEFDARESSSGETEELLGTELLPGLTEAL